jgi:F-type H+-transporting ATPase subunit alpha
MSLFRRRVSAPNQLAALREREAQVELGTVLYAGDGLAIVLGLDNDAPVGTVLSFVGGARGYEKGSAREGEGEKRACRTGQSERALFSHHHHPSIHPSPHSALLWRRSDNICFAVLLGGVASVGERVACRIKGILQVVDAADGPLTQREYDVATVPVGPGLAGAVVDYRGRALDWEGGSGSGLADDGISLPPAPGASPPLGTDAAGALFAECPPMEARSQICAALTTGVKGIDALTPLGRGQCLLVLGAPGSGKTTAALDAVLAQASSGVRCVVAAVGCQPAAVRAAAEALARKDALGHVTIVTAPAGAPLGERYVALCAAAAIAERARDGGGDALLVVDDGGCLPEMWERVTAALASLGPAVAEEDALGAVKTKEKDGEGAAEAAAAADGPRPSPPPTSSPPGDEGSADEALVEYEGMLVSAAAAARRRFFASLLQRAAKLTPRLGGGSLTMALVLPGVPASGRRVGGGGDASASSSSSSDSPAIDLDSYTTLSPVQREKMAAALAARAKKAAAGAKGGSPTGASAGGGVRTEVIEEFMSIADGQAVCVRGDGDAAYAIDPASSVSRIGARAYPPALRTLGPAVRLELAQAVDVARTLGPSAGSLSPAEVASLAGPRAAAALIRADRVRAALTQPSGHPVPVEEEAVTLHALAAGWLDAVPCAAVPRRLGLLMSALRRSRPGMLSALAGAVDPPGEDVLAELDAAMEEVAAAFQGAL